MTAQEDLAKARQRPDDVLAAVLEDHAEIKRLFAAVDNAADAREREERFDDLMHTLVIHETAEQEVTHPLARRAAGGDEIVARRLAEEKAGEHLLERMKTMNPADPDFGPLFHELHSDVLEHAENEESQEFPLIEGSVEPKQLEHLKLVFRAAEKMAPTRPHIGSPTSATGNLVVGPLLAIADRARDAIAAARRENA
jgi:hemerythrin superfamily protein